MNSYILSTDYISAYPTPFETANLPSLMPRMSRWAIDGEMPFLDLINPDVSFDFWAAYSCQYFENATGTYAPMF